MARIVISEFMDELSVETLRADFDVLYDPELVNQPDRLQAALEDAEALIVRNRTQVREPLLAQGPKLRVIGRLGVGLDNIDMDACRERDVTVYPATGANAQAVAEYVICTAMMLLRGAYASTAEVAAGAWPRARLSQGRELGSKTLGLVGFGAIGQLTAGMARALGMSTIAYDPHVPPRSLTEAAANTPLVEDLSHLLRQADVVSLHLPLNDDTRNLFDRRRLEAMKPGAVLINTARGGIVDEDALADLLRDGHLGGVALDVYAAEPLAGGTALAGAPNLILTPHVAGVTTESNQRVSAMIADCVASFLSQ